MEALKALNLGVRFFVVELGALAAAAYWGWEATSGPGRWYLAVLAPAAVIVVWALFISPKARFPTGSFGRALLGLIVFLLAAAALWSRDRTALAMVYGSLAVISSVLIFVWPQQLGSGVRPT